MKRILYPSLFVLLASIVAGCATSGGTTSAKGVGPEIRAVERWNHLIAGQAEKAYDYMTPGRRATQKRADYAQSMNNRPVRWQKVMLYKKDCGDSTTTCRISLQVDTQIPMAGMAAMSSSLGFVEETWVLDKDGQWYYLGAAPKEKQ